MQSTSSLAQSYNQEYYPNIDSSNPNNSNYSNSSNLPIGLDINDVPELYEVLRKTIDSGFKLLSIPLVHPRFRRDLISSNRDAPLTRSDIILDSRVWNSQIIGKISDWIVLDSSIDEIRKNSELAFKQEVAWGAHLSLFAMILPNSLGIANTHPFNYARVIQECLNIYPNINLWFRVSLDSSDWPTWNIIRTLCSNSPRLGIALILSKDLPSSDILDRWFGEPIRALFLSSDLMMSSERASNPTLFLLPLYQSIILRFSRLQIPLFISGKTTLISSQSIKGQRNLIESLFLTQAPMTDQEIVESPFYDYLQIPLQPLRDNLESQTYEVFEKDLIKYAKYEEAIYSALKNCAPTNSPIIIMIVGAGRGPIVTAAIRAAKAAGRLVKFYAIEKNPNAVITLRNNLFTIWKGENVTVVAEDMRVYKPLENADILVSELLGSFGDNELSPECLDGATRFLKPNGISIPYEYTSYISPVGSPKLWNEVNHGIKHIETPYVVKLFNVYSAAHSKSCFRFTHPSSSNSPLKNSRYACIDFFINNQCVVHGLAGYFTAKLYDKIEISIRPETASEGMFSWFPFFLPLSMPLFLQSNTEITVQLWRCISERRVWYEWSVVTPCQITPIHNPNGRSSYSES